MIKVSKKNLTDALKVVGKAIQSRVTLPVLSHVQLVASDYTLELTGTDLEKFIVAGVPCDDGELSITVPFKEFNNLVGTMPDTIELSVDGGRLFVKGKDVESELFGIDVQEFPLLPDTSELDPISINAQVLKGLIQGTIHAVADDESRPTLTGVCVQATGDELVFVSVDGFRMAVSRMPFTCRPATVIIPKPTMASIAMALDKSALDVDVFIEPGMRILVCLPEDISIDVYGQAIAGKFTDYQQIIPNTSCRKIVVDRDAMIQAVKQAGILGGLSDNRVLISVVGGLVSVKSEGMDVGETEAFVHPIEVDGDALETIVNARFMLDALATMGDEVHIEDNGNHKPVLVYTEREKHLCVVMPMFQRK